MTVSKNTVLFNLLDTRKPVKRLDMKSEGMKAKQTPQEIAQYRKDFTENGLWITGLFGGFALATLALVISSQASFAANSLNVASGLHWINGNNISWAELYLFSSKACSGLSAFGPSLSVLRCF